jgi:DnaK suppressor protein
MASAGPRLGRYAAAMDSDRAHQLVARERERIERAIADLGPPTVADQEEPGDRGSEDLYQHEFDAGRAEDLQAQLAAVERAEGRLADGTYGLSVESGEPIPDERLEALPTAERNVEEQERGGGG